MRIKHICRKRGLSCTLLVAGVVIVLLLLANSGMLLNNHSTGSTYKLSSLQKIGLVREVLYMETHTVGIEMQINMTFEPRGKFYQTFLINIQITGDFQRYYTFLVARYYY